jgi:hypothetical protein
LEAMSSATQNRFVGVGSAEGWPVLRLRCAARVVARLDNIATRRGKIDQPLATVRRVS